MAKSRTSDYVSVSYRLSDNTTNDNIKDINMSWENRSIDEFKDNLNTWLVASGIDLQVVNKTK